MSTKNEWEEKAEYLQSRGFSLVISALYDIDNTGDKWEASINGEGRRARPTIGEAVSAVYEWVTEDASVREP